MSQDQSIVKAKELWNQNQLREAITVLIDRVNELSVFPDDPSVEQAKNLWNEKNAKEAVRLLVTRIQELNRESQQRALKNIEFPVSHRKATSQKHGKRIPLLVFLAIVVVIGVVVAVFALGSLLDSSGILSSDNGISDDLMVKALTEIDEDGTSIVQVIGKEKCETQEGDTAAGITARWLVNYFLDCTDGSCNPGERWGIVYKKSGRWYGEYIGTSSSGEGWGTGGSGCAAGLIAYEFLQGFEE